MQITLELYGWWWLWIGLNWMGLDCPLVLLGNVIYMLLCCQRENTASDFIVDRLQSATIYISMVEFEFS